MPLKIGFFELLSEEGYPDFKVDNSKKYLFCAQSRRKAYDRPALYL
jgi:hypothetical protein